MLSLAGRSYARRVKRALLAAGLLAVLASVAVAQTDTGSLQGTVTDTTGAVVSGATVTVTNLGTGRVVTVQTGGSGDFSVPTLNPAQYKVEVKATNFKSLTQTVTLQVGQVLPLSFSLPAGAVSETVEVSSAVPQVATESSDLGEVIQGRQVVDLPLNARNFTQSRDLGARSHSR